MGTACTPEELKLAQDVKSDEWEEILPKQKLNPGYPETRHHIFLINNPHAFTHLRVNMYPDGGIARMHVYGIVERDWSKHDKTQMIDLARVDNGGRALGFTDAHYGKPPNLIALGRAPGMKYGWETSTPLSKKD
jgi:allantoicase